MTTKELGDLGEKLACEYLVDKGFKILGRNYRITFGELDIIAKKDNVVHFVEVKAIFENGGVFFPEEHVNWKKQKKLRHMSQIWLGKNKYPVQTPYQIDIVGVLVHPQTKASNLEYFPNAISG